MEYSSIFGSSTKINTQDFIFYHYSVLILKPFFLTLVSFGVDLSPEAVCFPVGVDFITKPANCDVNADWRLWVNYVTFTFGPFFRVSIYHSRRIGLDRSVFREMAHNLKSLIAGTLLVNIGLLFFELWLLLLGVMLNDIIAF